ncbi:hypothetical protein P3T22_001010 [Paraburkholderia sp. GAS348]
MLSSKDSCLAVRLPVGARSLFNVNVVMPAAAEVISIGEPLSLDDESVQPRVTVIHHLRVFSTSSGAVMLNVTAPG